ENGKLLPSVLALLDYIATRKQLVLETGHVSAEEALMVIKEARARGIAHVVATHGMAGPTNLSVAQAQEAARMGAYIEFVYGGTLEKGSTLTVADRKSTRLNSSHVAISYAVFCLKKKKKHTSHLPINSGR